ncbi:ABC transporter permease [Thermoflavimicrobium dichotomicum]|uniref:ABC transporter permease n=1 Tax=Thermoflavimicrobium dichotomicum TaxID=46223 RepID=UPI00313385C8
MLAIETWILPAPTQIWKTFWQQLPLMQADIAATIWIALLGLCIGIVFGVIVAVFLHLFPMMEHAFYPIIVLTQNVPIIALAPLLVLWFGFGTLPKVLIVVLVCFFPITIATLDGFRQVDPTLLRYMKIAGASRLEIFYKLEWPSALPSFFSGCKVAATYSVMGAVISEWLGAQAGLGLMMQTAASAFRTDRVFVAIGTIVILSLSLFLLIQLLEEWLIRWKIKKGE